MSNNAIQHRLNNIQRYILLFSILILVLVVSLIMYTEYNRYKTEIQSLTQIFINTNEIHNLYKLFDIKPNIDYIKIYSEYDYGVIHEFINKSKINKSSSKLIIDIYHSDITVTIQTDLTLFFESIFYKLLILLLIIVFFLIVINIIIQNLKRDIFNPITQLLKAIDKISVGNYACIYEIPDNEIGSMIIKFNNLIDILQSKEVIIQTHTHYLEDTIKKRTTQYQFLIENLDECIFMLDTNFNFTFCSSRIKFMLNIDPNSLINTNFHDLFLIDNNSINELYAEDFKTKEIKLFSYNLGHIYESEVHIGYQGTLQEITHSKKLEIQIGYTNKTLADIMDLFPIAALIINKHTHEVFYNNTKCENISDLILIEENNKYLNNDIIKHIMIDRSEENILFIEGQIKEKYYDIIYKEVLFNMIDSFLITINDIHDKKVKEIDLEIMVEARTKQLEEINKDLESFAYTVSHDIAKPLRIINGKLNIIKLEYFTQIPLHVLDEINIILESTLNLDMMVKGILELSRSSRGVLNINYYDMVPKIKSLWTDFELESAKLILPEKLIMKCDYRMMVSVFTNLISNAIKFSSDKLDIVIQIGYDQNKNAYFVKDNGCGFDQSLSEKLFDPFVTTSHVHSGTGIGLSTVKRIINKHLGKIWAESEINIGTTFYFTLNEDKSLC